MWLLLSWGLFKTTTKQYMHANVTASQINNLSLVTPARRACRVYYCLPCPHSRIIDNQSLNLWDDASAAQRHEMRLLLI